MAGMRFSTALATLAAALAFAVPASAQGTGPVIPDEAPVCTGVGDTITSCSNAGEAPEDPAATVGSGQVITDPADEIEGPKVDDDAATPQPQERGELHVLPAAAQESSAPAAAPVQAATTSPVSTGPREDDVAAARAASTGSAGAKTLPFTGVDAGPLALIGAMLLAAGLGLRRTVSA
jgi:hypothetical protein